MENLSTIIICAILVVICIGAVLSYRKKLSDGCCGSGGSIKREKAKDTDKSHYPIKKLVSIEGMSCKNCAIRIENTFHKQEGYLAEVNSEKGEMQLWMKKEVGDDEIIGIVAEAGYTVTDIKSV